MRGFITNLGKYNEGELVGKWIEFPIFDDELEEVLKKIGINDEYEEYFFTDYDESEGLRLSEFESIGTLNELGEKLESDIMKAVGELYGKQGVIDHTEWDFCLYPDINTDYELGYYWAEESGCYDFSNLGSLANYIDYEAFGRDIRIEADGGFTSYGWLERC